MGTFRHKDISAPLRFWHVDVMTGTFWHKDTLARDIMARTFDHWDFFCTRTFRHHGRYGTGTFWHKDILALEYFGIRIFWPMDVLVDVHFGTLQSNIFHVPKYPWSEMFQYCNIPMPKHQKCQKHTHAKKFLSRKYPCVRKFPAMKCPC